MCPSPTHIVITVQVTPSSGGPLTAGQTGFSLRCDVSGTDNLNSPTFTYQWQKDGDVISDQQGQTLSYSPLTASNAGQYICEVTVTSTSLSRSITIISNVQDVSIQSKNALYAVMYSIKSKIPFLHVVSSPTSVIATSDPVSPIQPVGSDVTLTCIVELSPAVDIIVIVNTVWTGPDGFMSTNTAQPVMGRTTTYTSTAMVSSFGRDQSGVNTCTATVSSTSQYLITIGSLVGSATIIAGQILQLMFTYMTL